MMRGLFYGPMNQKYSHAHDAISTVDRLPLLIMIAISVGFGIFPMHLYDVVRSGVDPLVAKITHVVPVAQIGEGPAVRSEAIILAPTGTASVAANKLLRGPSEASVKGRE
jgi:NADH-quinone oxidoreductase subunit M